MRLNRRLPPILVGSAVGLGLSHFFAARRLTDPVKHTSSTNSWRIDSTSNIHKNDNQQLVVMRLSSRGTYRC